MNASRSLVVGLLAVTLAGCAGGRKVDGLYGRWGRSYTVDDREHRAHVSEVWQFKGDSASVRATWTGSVPPGETVEGIGGAGAYRAVVDQGWDVRYRGQDVFLLEEKGRRVEGPKFMELEDSYELERDGNKLILDGGPSDEPLRPLLDAVAQDHPVKKKQ